MSDDVPYTVEEADRKMFIDLKDSHIREDFPHEFILNKPGIDKIMITPLPQGIIRVELSLGENVETKVFKQKRFQDKPDRIVIDIEFPDVEKQESKERKEEKVLRKNKIIVIDPGHGGDDPGAVGKLKTQEKNVVLDISRKLRDILNSKEGYRAFLTRDGDYYVPFKKRLKIAREYGADLFLSIHADAFRHRGARGSSVYCLSLRGASSEAAKLLARNENMADIIGGSPNGENSDESDPIILNMFQTNTINSSRTFGSSVIKHLDRVNKVKFGKVQEAPFIVLKLPEIPSLLVETAYISNPKEEKLLRSGRFQTEIANAIAASVKEFLPVAPGRPPKRPKIVLTKKEDDKKSVASSDDTDKIKAPQSTNYTIKKGDTLDIIARKHNTKISVLLRLNRMKLDDPLYFGRALKVPAAEKEISNEKRSVELKVSNGGEKSPPPAPSSASGVYMVKRGDTLEKIAKKNNTTIGVLLRLNKMKLQEPLYFGRKLKLPHTEATVREAEKAAGKKSKTYVYRVNKGDTLEKIARRCNTSVSELRRLNKIRRNDVLYVDQKLRLPPS
ncbi:MAG: N-acetylmuramoyl-L-alanine amidase [Syntrophales bacterium LBB04]|nr:N-acetylmuramoyl-L-alanine amidase [Syntrophales bacterium LBB04]